MPLSFFGGLFIFVLLMGLMNMLGGRYPDVDPNSPLDGRLVFRCILPGICAGAFALGYGFIWWQAFYVLAVVMAGSALWFAPGWSFDEITGVYSPNKYPLLIRKFGLWLIPNINSSAANKGRGVIMKMIRGLYDVGTFAGLYYINPTAPAYLIGTVLQGPIYWLMGRLPTGSAAVLDSEFVEGCWRGLLIALAITYQLGR